MVPEKGFIVIDCSKQQGAGEEKFLANVRMHNGLD